MEGNRAYYEALGFAYGNTLDAPWVGDGVPVLYFENERQSTPSITTDENEIAFDGTTIMATDAAYMALYNMQGQLITTTNGTTLNVSNIANGIYIVSATNAQGERTTRKVAVR